LTVCRTFGLKRTTLPTLIDFLTWIGWSAGLRVRWTPIVRQPEPRFKV
jgi:hypothetical protein